MPKPRRGSYIVGYKVTCTREVAEQCASRIPNATVICVFRQGRWKTCMPFRKKKESSP